MNTSLVHADIFFFVTTVAVAVLTILVIIAWIYIIRILANIRAITDKARIEGEFLLDEVRELRERLNRNRFGIVALYDFIRHVVGRW